MKYFFVYETKNTINGKIYVGVHQTNNINDGYIGCGIKSSKSLISRINYLKKVKRKIPHFILAVEKYGYDKFVKKIIKYCNNYEEALKHEAFIVDYEFISKSNTYNEVIGGFGGGAKTLESRYKNSLRMKNNNPMYDPLVREKVSNSKKGIKLSEKTKNKISIKSKIFSNMPHEIKRRSVFAKNRTYGIDDKFYYLKHKNGECFEGKKKEFLFKYSLNVQNFSAFSNGKLKTFHGWILLNILK